MPGCRDGAAYEERDLGLVSLTGAVRPVASSSEEGRDAEYATDENNLSFWLPRADDDVRSLECDLAGEFETAACRIFWREVGLDYENGVTPAPVKYID